MSDERFERHLRLEGFRKALSEINEGIAKLFWEKPDENKKVLGASRAIGDAITALNDAERTEDDLAKESIGKLCKSISVAVKGIEDPKKRTAIYRKAAEIEWALNGGESENE